MNREKVREAVAMAIRNDGLYLPALLSSVVTAVMALDKPVTVTREGLSNALFQKPYASEHPDEVMERLRRYLTAQGVNVEDE